MKILSESEVQYRRKRAIFTSVSVSLLLTILKVSVGVFTMSLSLFSSALDSLGDFFISLSNIFVLKKSEASPTKNFQYGFGKIEGISSLFQGIFIMAIGGWIVVKGILSLFNGYEVQNTQNIVLVMIFSTITVFFLSRFLQKEAAATKSLVLEADCAHYKSDYLSNVSIVLGSAIIYLFHGFYWIDSFLAMGVAGLIVKDGFSIAKKAIEELLDREIEPETKKIITSILKKYIHEKKITGIHCLKTRRSGMKIFLELHLVFSEDILLKTAHDVGDEIEAEMKQKIHSLHATFHLDPLDDGPH
ncbi:MAG: cation diffusion facilitator family transporter [Candidatus Peregrinibacteria bacterium]